MDIDTLLTKISLPDTRATSLNDNERKQIFEYWSTNKGFRNMLDDLELYQGDKPSERINTNYYNYNKPVNNDEEYYRLTIAPFVSRVLIPAIRNANNQDKLSPFIRKASTKTKPKKRETLIEPSVEVAAELAPSVEQLIADVGPDADEIIEVERENTNDATNELENLDSFMENMLQQMSDSGDKKVKILIFVVMYIIELGIESLKLLDLIKDTERNSFETDNFQSKFKTIGKIILRTLSKLIYAIQNLCALPGGKILFFIIVIIIYNTQYGRFFINSFLLAFKTIINFCFKQVGINDFLQSLKDKLDDLQVKVSDIVTSFFTSLLNKIFQGAFEDWIQTWLDKKTEDFKNEISKEILNQVQNGVNEITQEIASKTGEVVGAITDQIASHTGEVVGAISDKIASQSGEVVGAITDKIASYSGNTLSTISRQILSGEARQTLMILGPVASIPVAKIFEDTLSTLNGASNIDDIGSSIERSNELLNSILNDLHFTLVDAISAGRELSPEQINSIADEIVEKLKYEKPTLITNAFSGIQKILTDGAATALMTAPAIKELLNVGPRRIANYGGKTRKNKKVIKTKSKKTKKNKGKAKKSKKAKKVNKTNKIKKTKKSKK
jgi:hypothetical protein